MKNLRLGEVLVQDGYISESQLQTMLELQKNDPAKKRLGQIIIESGIINETQMLSALSKRLGISYISLLGFPIDIDAVDKIPKQVAQKYNALAISKAEGILIIAVNDPLDLYAIEDIKLIVNQPIEIACANKEEIQKYISYWYSEIDTRKAAKTANATADPGAGIAIEDLNETADDTPVVTLVNTILYKAHNAGASDIHIEPFEDKTVVRIRVDGQILEYLQLSQALHNSIVARIKILGGMDIAERRVPQDGHFRAKLQNIEINVRVSVLPTVFGEKAVLRFFSQNAQLDHSGTFGMAQDDFERVSKILQSPHGILYITGPTGSGKTTTLYMIIEMLAKKAVNISTIEDPVERHLAKVNQTQTNAQAGLTFASGLRSLLRQDPDIIMVGETRDNETANIAVSAALTGHLVLSTLHTNDAVSAILRLVDMGIEEYMISNSLIGVVAQRLAKKICLNCKTEYTPGEHEQALLGMKVDKLYKGSGCNVCNHTGYKGRIAIHEVLTIDSNIRGIVSRKEPLENVYSYLRDSGKHKSLKDSIIRLVAEGVTTIDEMNKLMYMSD